MRAEIVFLMLSVGIFFPIYITTNIVVDYTAHKMYFCVKCFNISVFGGYVVQKREKIFFHISDKRAVIFNLADYVKQRKRLFKIKGIELLNIYVFTKRGIEADNYLMPESLFIICSTVFPLLKNKKKFVKLHNTIVLSAEKTTYSIASLKFVFNIITIIIIMLKGVTRGVFKNDKR